jgi:hypothetical protein
MSVFKNLFVARFGVMTSIMMMGRCLLYLAPFSVLFELAVICCVCPMVWMPAAQTGESAMNSSDVLDATGGRAAAR